MAGARVGTGKDEPARGALATAAVFIAGRRDPKTRREKPGLETGSPQGPSAPAAPSEARAGLVNASGLTNGRGLVNGRGLTNGRGSVNGRDLVGGKRQKRGAVTGRKTESALAESAGFLDSKGLTNGKGLVNGAGLTNGKGLVNGRRLMYTEAQKERRRGFAKRTSAALAVLLAFLVVVLPALYSTLLAPSPVTIDGSFDDWADWEKVAKLDDSPSDQPDNPNINLVAFMARATDRDLYLYVAMQANGHPFNGPNAQGAESVRILIDKDHSAGTGFCAFGIGADYMVEIQGYQGRVQTSSLKVYTGGSGSCDAHSDATAWQSAGAVRAAVGGSKIEADVRLADLGGMRATDLPYMLVVAQDSLGRMDVGDVIFSTLPGLIYFVQAPAEPDYIPQSGSSLLLSLQARAYYVNLTLFTLNLFVDSPNGGCIRLTSVRVTSPPALSGPSVTEEQNPPGGCVSGGSSVTIRMNTLRAQTYNYAEGAKQIDIYGNAGGTGGASTVRVYLRGPSDLGTGPGPAGFSGHGSVLPPLFFKYSYVGYPGGGVPPSPPIRIDGAFADWKNNFVADALNDVTGLPPQGQDAGLDIRYSQADVNNAARTVSFYLEVAGSIMQSSDLPIPTAPRPQEPSSGGSASPAPPAEDIATIYIDVDSNVSTGWKRFPGLGADAIIEVHGAGGGYGRLARSTSTSLVVWNTGTQSFVPRNSGLPVGFDSSRMETQVLSTDLCAGTCGLMRYVFYMYDAGSRSDNTDILSSLPPRGDGEAMLFDERSANTRNAYQGDRAVPVTFFSLANPSTNEQGAVIDSFQFQVDGVTPADIPTAAIYRDVGTHGAFDEADLAAAPVAEGVFVSGSTIQIFPKAPFVLAPGEHLDAFVTVDIASDAAAPLWMNGSIARASGVHATGLDLVRYSYPPDPAPVHVLLNLGGTRGQNDIVVNEVNFDSDWVEVYDTSGASNVSLASPSQLGIIIFHVSGLTGHADAIRDFSGSTNGAGFASVDIPVGYSGSTTYYVSVFCNNCSAGNDGSGNNTTFFGGFQLPSSSARGAYGRYTDGSSTLQSTDNNTRNAANTIPEFQDAVVPTFGAAALILGNGWRRRTKDNADEGPPP